MPEQQRPAPPVPPDGPGPDGPGPDGPGPDGPGPDGPGPDGPGPGDVVTGGPTYERTVVSADDIDRAVQRIAHELLERDRSAADLVLLGVPTRGVPLAERIAAALETVDGLRPPTGSLDVTMYRDDLRHHPTRGLAVTAVPVDVTDRVVVLVDDVLSSGRTIRAALDAVADLGRPRAVRLVVLVDRGHRELPIRADHVGRNLPTAAEEKVAVRLRETDGSDGVDIVRPVPPQAGPA